MPPGCAGLNGELDVGPCNVDMNGFTCIQYQWILPNRCRQADAVEGINEISLEVALRSNFKTPSLPLHR